MDTELKTVVGDAQHQMTAASWGKPTSNEMKGTQIVSYITLQLFRIVSASDCDSGGFGGGVNLEYNRSRC